MDATENKRFEEALALLEEQRYREAAESFSEVIALRPEMSGAYGNRGLCYLNLGMDDRARSDFETVLRLDPCDAMGHSMLADLARFQGGTGEVLEQINLALANDPDEPQAHFIRGWLFARAGQYDMAAMDLARFMELTGDNDEVREFYEACVLLASERPRDADGTDLDTPEKADRHLGLRGWSFNLSENRDYQEQGLPCPYAHCIRNCSPLSPETPEGCPVFGNACPGRLEQVNWCREHPQLFE
ncbi:MAG: tetratricopeptide repeat protein [Planctomycetota bacterium]|jgi:tetratricopeptide (TPR) repeat protein|nr:tetratricopeptide repeat protein [Planctomycetota bacterium]